MAEDAASRVVHADQVDAGTDPEGADDFVDEPLVAEREARAEIVGDDRRLRLDVGMLFAARGDVCGGQRREDRHDEREDGRHHADGERLARDREIPERPHIGSFSGYLI